MCKFSSKSGGVPFQPLGDLTWNDPNTDILCQEVLSHEKSRMFPLFFLNCAFLINNCYRCLAVAGSASG